ncbi:hypothetical protein N7535_004578 [Penicillium sp. DV-2018c]|nr:hypothetical protein N7461_008158 [Penicillium sp. DV-2018c]KAJ5570918.1 hypothetical protein N7535_004578 [Penicillium sp. DV-2018c]
MSESEEQLRKLKLLQLADLGTARREKITTSDEYKQAQVQLSAIESQRQIAQRDQAVLNKWANFHNEVADTGGMEGLDDIAAGQSHRANLHAMLHPNGTQPKAYSNLPMNRSSAGRGRGHVRTRSEIRPSPSPQYVSATPASSRYESLSHPTGRNAAYESSRRALSSVGGHRGGPVRHARSVTASPSCSLDPALNRNNDAGDGHDRGRGRSLARGRGRGRAQEPPLKETAPAVPPRAKRPPPTIDYSAMITRPADFMSLMSAMQPGTSSSHQARGQGPPTGDKEKMAERIANPPPRPPLVEASTPQSRAGPVEKKTSTKSTDVQPTKSKTPGPHIGPYPVQTPKSPLPAPVAKGPGSNKPSKAIAAAYGPLHKMTAGVPVEKLDWKIPPNEAPRKQAGSTPSKKKPPVISSPPAKGSKQITPANSQTTKSKQYASPESLPKMGPSSAGVPAVGERSAAASRAKAEVKSNIAQANTVGNKKPIGDSADLVATRVAKFKQTAPPQHLLDMDPPSTSFPALSDIPVTPSRSEAKAIASPSATELAGLNFTDRPVDSKPPRTIDEVISRNLMGQPTGKEKLEKSPLQAQTERAGQDSRSTMADTYGPQILEELRNLGKVLRPPQAQDLEKIEEIFEKKLREMMPLVASWAAKRDITAFGQHGSSPISPSESRIASPSPEKGQTWEDLGSFPKTMHPPRAQDLEEIVEKKLREMMPLVTPWAAKRDITPFERHRSPPPPSSSESNTPQSAEKRKTKPRVPGLSPTRSEDSDIITRLETLQVSDKLAAPPQPERATNTTSVSSLKPIDAPKRTSTFDAAVSRPRDEPGKKSLPLLESVHAGPRPLPTASVSTNVSTIGTTAGRSPGTTPALKVNLPNVLKPQDDKAHGVRVIGPSNASPIATQPGRSPGTTQTLSVNHPNVPKPQDDKTHGVRVIGPSNASTIAAHAGRSPGTTQTLSVNHPNVPKPQDDKPRGVHVIGPSPYMSTAAPENQSSQQGRRLFSMPDRFAISQPKVQTRLPPFQPRK